MNNWFSGNQSRRFLFFILLLVGLIFLGRSLDVDIERMKAILWRYPLWLSGILYILLYVGFTLLIWIGPKDVFRISGAVLYGPYISTVLVSIAEMINLTILFNMSRKLGRGFIEEKMKIKHGDVNAVQKKIGWFNCFALRINPLIPYRFLDLAYGLTGIAFKKYFLVALLASPPRIFWLQFILAAVGISVLKDFKAMPLYFQEHQKIFFYSIFYLLFVFVVSMVAVGRNIARGPKAIKKVEH
jgi:uncharacterized membrane protein YdjX (TVP38/TMEM64 family)